MRKGLRGVLTLFIVAMCLLAASAAQAAPAEKGVVPVTPAFGDVSTGNSNVLFINYLSSRGIVGGFPDGTYRPGEGLTRAEAAAVLVKAAGLSPSAGPSAYSDVAGHWAAGVINAASAAGMISGYPDGAFRPEALITRAEGMAMFLRLSKQPDPGVAMPAPADVSPGHWAARPVAIGLAAGMAAGGRNFFPDSSLTRGDMARMLGVLLTKDPDLSRADLKINLKVTAGTAGVTRGGSGQTEEITPGAGVQVNAGDIIKTGSGCTAQLILPDGSGMLLEEGAQLTVKEARGRSYITADGRPGVAVDWLNLDMDKGGMFGTLAKNYRPGAPSGGAAGDNTAASGIRDLPSVAGLNLWNIRDLLAVGEAGGEVPWWESSSQQAVRVQVDMPWGVAGVRGTTWRVALDESGNASFSILDGEGQLTAGGATQSVGQLQVVNVPYGAAPGQATAMSPEEVKAFVQEAVKQWLQERAEDMQANSQLYVQLDEAAPPSIVETINQAIEEAIKESQPTTTNTNNSGNNNDDNNDDNSTVDTWGIKRLYPIGETKYSPAISDGNIYMVDNTGSIYALNSDTSVVQWVYETGEWASAAPAVNNNGKVYVGVGNFKIYTLYDGKLVNTFNTYGDSLVPQLAIDTDGTVYAGVNKGISEQSTLFALYPDGTEKWSLDLGYYLKSPVLGPEEGTIYITKDSVLAAVYSNGSGIKWTFDTGNFPYYKGPVTSSPLVSVEDGTVYVGTDTGYLFAINSNGTDKWYKLVDSGSPILYPPVEGPDGTIYVSTLNGKVYAIDPVDGSIMNGWPFEAGGVINNPLAVDENGTVYVYFFDGGSYEGAIVALDGYTAGEKWTLRTGGYTPLPTATPVIGPDGTVYLVIMKGTLCAIGENTGSNPVLLENEGYFNSTVDPYALIYFSKYIKKGGSFDSIVLLDENGDPVKFPLSLSITGNALQINVIGDIGSSNYYAYTLRIPPGAITDMNGKPFSGEDVYVFAPY